MSENKATQRCIVLGGTGFVGSAVVRRLVDAGAEVAFSWHRQQEAAAALARDTGARPFPFDLGADPEGSVLDTLWPGEPIDALLQCIGTAGDPALYDGERSGLDKLLQTSAAEWQAMQDTTSTTTFVACRRLALRLQRGANIVLVGSIDGVKTVPAPVHYAAGKAAVGGLARALTKALGPQGVCVNMIAAGMLDGGLGRHLSDGLRAQYLKHCSLKRLGRADEIAQFAGWLALCNTYISGQALVLDGGL